MEDGIFISQSKYARDLVKKFGLDLAKATHTPMGSTAKLGKDLKGKAFYQTLYRSMIGSLLYLTTSRPDIAFSVGSSSRYQSAPKDSHHLFIKRIIKYILGTLDYGLWYPYDTTGEVVGYTDADWAGCSDDHKSTSEGYFYVGNYIVAWHSKKQNSISLSTTEAEYITAGSYCS